MGAQKKKKWSAKGRVKDKLQNKVVFDQETLDKLVNDVPKYKLITTSVVSDRLKVNGSVARQGLDYLLAKGLIAPVVTHGAQDIYTTAKGAPAPAPPAK